MMTDASSRLDPDVRRPPGALPGLVVAVTQQYDTPRGVMVGYMDDEALRRTLTTGPGGVLEPQPWRLLAQG